MTIVFSASANTRDELLRHGCAPFPLPPQDSLLPCQDSADVRDVQTAQIGPVQTAQIGTFSPNEIFTAGKGSGSCRRCRSRLPRPRGANWVPIMFSKRHLPDILQRLQCHPEAGSFWPSWPENSFIGCRWQGREADQAVGLSSGCNFPLDNLTLGKSTYSSAMEDYYSASQRTVAF